MLSKLGLLVLVADLPSLSLSLFVSLSVCLPACLFLFSLFLSSSRSLAPVYIRHDEIRIVS